MAGAHTARLRRSPAAPCAPSSCKHTHSQSHEASDEPAAAGDVDVTQSEREFEFRPPPDSTTGARSPHRDGAHTSTNRETLLARLLITTKPVKTTGDVWCGTRATRS
jgi:hypothetical protein